MKPAIISCASLIAYLFPFTVAAAVQFENPIVITSGGTYSGNWLSLDANIPAVLIQTAEPVTLVNCRVNSASDGVVSRVTGARIIIEGCRGAGLDPRVYGKERGAFLRVMKAASVTVEHNDMSGFAFGINSWGNMTSSSFVFQYNRVHDLDGAESDGQGGRLIDAAHMEFGQDNGNHAVIMDSMQNMTYAEIAWNSFVQSSPLKSVGDIVNIYRSSGTAQTPIQIHDNYFHGGYAARPGEVAVCCAPNAVTSEAIAVDGSSADTPSTATAYVQIFNNLVVNNGGAQGIGINAGHDNQIFGNRIISTGRLATDGSWFAATYSNPLTVWNGVYHQPSDIYFNNMAYDNMYGWMIATLNSTGNARTSPVHLSGPNFQGCSSQLCYNNHQMIVVTSSVEDAQWSVWRTRLAVNRLRVGP